MAPQSSILAWKIPWTEEPGRLQSIESDTTKRLHFHFSLSHIGEGNGNPLRCSCLENPRDGGAWWAAVYGVAQSRTQLKWLSSSSSSLSVQLWLFLFCFTLRKLQLSISWNTFYSLYILINQVTQLTHHSIKNNYTRHSAGNAKTGAQNCSHAAQAALQSMAQRLQPHHHGRVKNTYSQGQILVGLGSQTRKSAFPRMPHMLLACGPENNLEKHRHSDNDTLLWQGLQRTRWVWSGCKSKGGEIYPPSGGQSSQDLWLVIPGWRFRGFLKSECQC